MSDQRFYVGDHYRGKKLCRFLLTLSANPMFRACLHRDWVDNIQFINTEIVGLEGRIDYFIKTGGFQDFIWHQLQLYSLLVNPASKANIEAILSAQVEAIEQSQIVVECSVRGQYLGGLIGHETVSSFLAEIQEFGALIDPKNSRVETLYAIKLICHLEPFIGVPFYFLFGKRVGQKKRGAIVVQFAPNSPLGQEELVMDLIENKIKLSLVSKTAESGFYLQRSHYEIPLESSGIDGHTRLLLDCINGDNSLASNSELSTAIWRLISPLAQEWTSDHFSPIPTYYAGGDLPKEAHLMIQEDHRKWALS